MMIPKMFFVYTSTIIYDLHLETSFTENEAIGGQETQPTVFSSSFEPAVGFCSSPGGASEASSQRVRCIRWRCYWPVDEGVGKFNFKCNIKDRYSYKRDNRFETEARRSRPETQFSGRKDKISRRPANGIKAGIISAPEFTRRHLSTACKRWKWEW